MTTYGIQAVLNQWAFTHGYEYICPPGGKRPNGSHKTFTLVCSHGLKKKIPAHSWRTGCKHKLMFMPVARNQVAGMPPWKFNVKKTGPMRKHNHGPRDECYDQIPSEPKVGKVRDLIRKERKAKVQTYPKGLTKGRLKARIWKDHDVKNYDPQYYKWKAQQDEIDGDGTEEDEDLTDLGSTASGDDDGEEEESEDGSESDQGPYQPEEDEEEEETEGSEMEVEEETDGEEVSEEEPEPEVEEGNPSRKLEKAEKTEMAAQSERIVQDTDYTEEELDRAESIFKALRAGNSQKEQELLSVRGRASELEDEIMSLREEKKERKSFIEEYKILKQENTALKEENKALREEGTAMRKDHNKRELELTDEIKTLKDKVKRTKRLIDELEA